jgi:hypothetical protein
VTNTYHRVRSDMLHNVVYLVGANEPLLARGQVQKAHELVRHLQHVDPEELAHDTQVARRELQAVLRSRSFRPRAARRCRFAHDELFGVRAALVHIHLGQVVPTIQQHGTRELRRQCCWPRADGVATDRSCTTRWLGTCVWHCSFLQQVYVSPPAPWMTRSSRSRDLRRAWVSLLLLLPLEDAHSETTDEAPRADSAGARMLSNSPRGRPLTRLVCSLLRYSTYSWSAPPGPPSRSSSWW